MTSLNTSYTYCPHCAAPLTQEMRGGRMRTVCGACGFVHYRNPTVGVAVVVLRNMGTAPEILMGRRAPGVSYGGQWCIPCGHVEWDEEVRTAAQREFAEETGLQVRVGDVIAVHSNFHNPAQHTVGIWFRGHVQRGVLRASDDLDRVAYFPVHAPPAPLAFPTDRLVLQQLAAACENRAE